MVEGVQKACIRQVWCLNNALSPVYTKAKPFKRSVALPQVLVELPLCLGRTISDPKQVHADEDDLGQGDNSKAGEEGPPQNGFVSMTSSREPREMTTSSTNCCFSDFSIIFH